MIVVYLSVGPLHKFTLHESQTREAWSGQCSCPERYKGPWRTNSAKAKDDWMQHVRLADNLAGSTWVMEASYGGERHVLVEINCNERWGWVQGPCSNDECVLPYAHSGPCFDVALGVRGNQNGRTAAFNVTTTP